MWCPLEERARIIRGGTPRLAKQVSQQYVPMNAPAVCHDFEANLNLKITQSTMQNRADWVGSIAQAKEQDWTYSLPELIAPVSTIADRLDGATILMPDDGGREARVGALSW